MKFIDTNGKIHRKNITKYKKKQSSKSKGQTKLGEILENIYPNVPIYEEVPCFGEKLFLDFFIPSIKIALEFNGIQHDKYVYHFHRTRIRFLDSLERDCRKQQWCDINNIALLIIKEEDLKKEIIIDMIGNRK